MKKDHMIAHIVKTDCRIPKSNAYWFKVLLASFYIFNCSNLLLAGDYSGTATCPVTHTGCVYSDNIYSPKEETSRAIFGFKDNQLDYNEYYRAYAFVDLTSIPSGVAIAGGDIDIGAVVEENVRNQSIGIRVNILPYEFNDWNSKGLADKWSSLDESGPNLLNEWTNSGGWYQTSLDPFLDWFVSRSELGFKYKINPESITDFPSIPDNDSILFAASIESLEIDYCYWPSIVSPINSIESPYTNITLRWEGELLNPLKYHVQWSRQSFGGTLIDNGEDYTTGTSYNIYCRANERIEWRVRLVNPECDNCNSIWAQDFDFYTGTLMEGYVRTVTGEPLEGVTLTFNYGGGSTTTNAEGFYSQELPYGWPADGDEPGIGTPTKSGYSFESKEYPTSSEWYDQDYIGRPILTPSIAKSRSSIDFGNSINSDTFQVWNDGTGTLNYGVTISEGGSYFSITPPTSGSSSGSSDKKTHTVAVNRDNISPGQTVTGKVKVYADADDSPQYIDLSASRSVVPSIAKDRTSIDFGSSIDSDTFQVWNDGTGTLNYGVTISDGGSYFTVTPPLNDSSTGTSDKNTHTVTVNRNNIPQGQTVTGQVTISSSNADDSPHYINLLATEPAHTVTLTGLSILGDSSIPEDGSESYTAMASWSEGSPTDVTSSTTWSVSSEDYCYFSGNTLYNENTSGSNKTVTITARYTSGEIATTRVTLQDTAPIPTDLSISGDPSIPENGSSSYTAKIIWSDGSTSSVLPSGITWSVSSTTYCHFSGSTLYNDNSSGSSKMITITASYNGSGISDGIMTVTLQDSPYGSHQIATKADLLAVSANTGNYDNYFILTADIDLSGEIFTTAIIAPSSDVPFTGIFDGGGHKITGLTIDTNGADKNYLGLFGYVGDYAEIKNLGVINVSISGGDNSSDVGALVGRCFGSVTSCYASGTVSGFERVGCLAGWAGGDVSDCYAIGTVTGEIKLGGLAGRTDTVAGGFGITRCYAGVTVNGNDNSYGIGGLIGVNAGGWIRNCYATGNVTGNTVVGGLVGENGGGGIENCYAIGSVAGNSSLGGLIGYSDGFISNCFWDVQTSGLTISDGGTGINTVTMQNLNTFLDAGWDFVEEIENGTEDMWIMLPTIGYPHFSWQTINSIPVMERLEIVGISSIPEDSSRSYSAVASWSDDTSTPVPANWSISNNAYGYFDGNILYNDNTSGSNQIVTITASYTIGDVMKVGEMNVIMEGNASVITLTGLSIMGDSSIPEDSSESYIARASWSNGSTLDVTSNTIWSENSPYCSFSFFNKSKLYNKNNSGSNQKVTIYASYTSGDRTETASKDIYLLDSTSVITLTDLSISGKLSILEGGSCPYTATASWSDGLTMNVTGETTWSLSNDDYCYFSGNMLYNDNTSGGNQTATIMARYTSDGITLDKTQKVMLYGSNRIEGSIVTWGFDSSSQDFGAMGKDFVKVTTGGYHSIGLRADDSVVACGLYNAGQCDVPMPNVDFMTVAAGDYHSLGLKADGAIVAWGAGQPGQSGYNDYEQCDVPLPNCEFVDIAACDSHSLGLKSDGSVVAWGQTYGGVNDVPAVNTDFVQVTTGINLSAGLKNDGSISVWGQNYTGEYDAPAPNADFIAVAAGGLHLLGLKDNGSIVAWGNNYRGQCNVPAPNSNFVAIAAGDLHSLGLKADGSIVAWGYNKDGQCDVPSPNAGFVAISADGSTSAAIRDASQSQTEQFLLTVDQKGEGIISAVSGLYESGEIVTIHVTPAEGWRVKGWHGTNNDSSMNLTNTVTMYSDKTVTVEFEEIPIDGLSISKVTIKAGRNRNSSLDSIQIEGCSLDSSCYDFINAEDIYLCVSHVKDGSNYIVWDNNIKINLGNVRKNVFYFNKKDGNGNVRLELDLNPGTFFLSLKNIDLSGCKSPICLNICIGNYYSSGTAYDGGVLGSGGVTDVINGKKGMPIQFLSGVENSLRVDKCTFRLGTKKPNTDCLTVQGAITVDDTSINIAKEDVHVTWGDYEVVLPADDLYRIGYKKAYKFKKPRGSDTSVAAAIFDLEKCTFKIVINKANIGYQGSPVEFGIFFGTFDETTETAP